MSSSEDNSYLHIAKDNFTMFVSQDDSCTSSYSTEPIDSSVLEKLALGDGSRSGEAGRRVAPVAYVTNVSLAQVCLCCKGQQARRCSLNVGESGTLQNKHKNKVAETFLLFG